VTADDGGDPGASARAGLVGLEGPVTDSPGAPPGRGALGYRLHPSIELFPVEDDVYLLRPGRAPVVVRAPEPVDRDLLARLATEPVTVATGSDISRRLEPLVAAGAVVAVEEATPLPGPLADRFSRQLPYFADTGDPAATQLRLRDSSVAVLGCGGLGTWALGALACLGIGRFTLVDDDVVELSNLNRQVLYGVADVGRPKVECAERWMRALDPDVEVRAIRRRVASADDAGDVIAGADILILAADWPPYELARWVNGACVRAGVPFLMAAQQPPLLKVGPTFVPGRGPCFACQERRLAADFPLYPELAEHRRRHPGPDVTLGPASGVVGTLVALEVLHVLMGSQRVATQGRSLLIDMRTLEQRWEAVERDPSCPVCGPVHATGGAGTVRAPPHGATGPTRKPARPGVHPPAAPQDPRAPRRAR
jgi:molybdopterin-synthase adenylyltransferase